jgi:hypothetical protein
MEDFRHDDARKDGWMVPDACSRHPAYAFEMSTRDLARFGLMFLRDGRWGTRQVIPADWVATSVLPYSHAGTRGAYGYMWWLARSGTGFPGVVQPEGSFSAQGAGGHFLRDPAARSRHRPPRRHRRARTPRQPLPVRQTAAPDSRRSSRGQPALMSHLAYTSRRHP